LDDNGRVVRVVEGDTSAQRAWTYSWDAEDQLVAVTTPDEALWRYTYDPFGRRVLKTHGATETEFVWNGNVVVHELSSEQRRDSWVYDPNSFVPVASVQNRTYYAAVTDFRGMVRELIDDRGTVAWAANYTSWASVATIARARDVDCAIRLPGQWYDAESGLHYNRYRYYEPASGRFLSQDPLGLQGGINPYAYAPNPFDYVDLFGLNFGSGKPPHQATVSVWRPNEDGSAMNLVSQTPLRSGNMTPSEAALGFPQSSLATHTENRAARNIPLQPGDVMVIHGQYPPCTSCKGAMNRANTNGATVIYVWTDENGQNQRWQAGQRRRRKGACGPA